MLVAFLGSTMRYVRDGALEWRVLLPLEAAQKLSTAAPLGIVRVLLVRRHQLLRRVDD